MSETEHSTEIDVSLESIVEAILFAAGKPMTPQQIVALFPDDEQPELDEIKLALDNVREDYEERGIELQKVASGYRFQVRKRMIPWISELWGEKAPRYTRALLETLALIAYRQPITRGEIEDIRGVSVSSNIIRTLQEREWVRVVGRRDVPGRPSMYATTRQFLDYFNLTSLNELPPLGEVSDLDAMAEKLEIGLQQELKGMSAVHREQQDETQEQDSEQREQAVQREQTMQSGEGKKGEALIPEVDEAILVDHDAAKAFKEEKEKADLEVFSTVDELLASVKTDFTDFSPDEERQTGS